MDPSSELSNQRVQRTGASRFAQRHIEHPRRLAPVEDLIVRRRLYHMDNRKMTIEDDDTVIGLRTGALSMRGGL